MMNHHCAIRPQVVKQENLDQVEGGLPTPPPRYEASSSVVCLEPLQSAQEESASSVAQTLLSANINRARNALRVGLRFPGINQYNHQRAMEQNTLGHEAMEHEAMGHEAMEHEAMEHEAMEHEAIVQDTLARYNQRDAHIHHEQTTAELFAQEDSDEGVEHFTYPGGIQIKQEEDMPPVDETIFDDEDDVGSLATQASSKPKKAKKKAVVGAMSGGRRRRRHSIKKPHQYKVEEEEEQSARSHDTNNIVQQNQETDLPNEEPAEATQEEEEMKQQAAPRRRSQRDMRRLLEDEPARSSVEDTIIIKREHNDEAEPTEVVQLHDEHDEGGDMIPRRNSEASSTSSSRNNHCNEQEVDGSPEKSDLAVPTVSMGLTTSKPHEPAQNEPQQSASQTSESSSVSYARDDEMQADKKEPARIVRSRSKKAGLSVTIPEQPPVTTDSRRMSARPRSTRKSSQNASSRIVIQSGSLSPPSAKRKRTVADAAPPQGRRLHREVKECDVICGPYARNVTEGALLYRQLIYDGIARFRKKEPLEEIWPDVLTEINSGGGRFVRAGKDGNFYMMSEDSIREKIEKAIKDETSGKQRSVEPQRVNGKSSDNEIPDDGAKARTSKRARGRPKRYGGSTEHHSLENQSLEDEWSGEIEQEKHHSSPSRGKKSKAAEKHEDVSEGEFEVRSTDVKGGTRSRNWKGNILYREVLWDRVEDSCDDVAAVIEHVVNAVKGQTPPGRFLSADNKQVLTDAEISVKVKGRLNYLKGRFTGAKGSSKDNCHGNEESRSEPENGKAPTEDYHTNSVSEAESDPGEFRIRETDVLGGQKANNGTRFYRQLLQDNVEGYHNDKETFVARVVEAIRRQNPPGRFLSKDNTSELDKKGIKVKILGALSKEMAKRARLDTSVDVEANAACSVSENNDNVDGSEKISAMTLRKNDVEYRSGGISNHSGNRQYRALVKEYAAKCNETDIKEVATCLLDKIHNQDPPGRLFAPDNRTVLTGKAERKKVVDALVKCVKYAASSASSDLSRVGGDGFKPSPAKRQKPNPMDESDGEQRPTDVIGGMRCSKSPGNVLFRKLILEHLDDYKEDQDRATRIVLEKIHKQDPPGRFWKSCNKELMSEKQEYFKANRTFGDRLRLVGGKAKVAKRPPRITTRVDSRPIITPGPSDVPGGAKASTSVVQSGSGLFHEFVAQYASSFDTDSQATTVDTIYSAIRAQTPEGRFLSSDNRRFLTAFEARIRIWSALKECWEQRSRNGGETPLCPAVPEGIGDESVSVEAAALEKDDQGHSLSAVVSRGGSDDDETDVSNETAKSGSVILSQTNVESKGTYIEDTAWRKLMSEKGILEALPPPDPIPSLPTDSEETSCSWTYDEASRTLRARLKQGEKSFSESDLTLLQELMERDDIAVITGGHCQDLNTDLWDLASIADFTGEKFHHRFRLFERTGDGAYEEKSTDFSMRLMDYKAYLNKRTAVIAKLEKGGTEDESCDRKHEITTASGETIELDVINDIVYLLDYDVKKLLPTHYQEFKREFSLRECLPGGAMCLMQSVNEAAQPDMGPNMYVTPPGSFTWFHRDGNGTVDSGHLALAGYNEVIMMRRLPLLHEQNAIDVGSDKLYEQPHAHGLGRKDEWPSKARIEQLNKLNYCAIVLILGPGELLHIGKGRFHAFRKFGPDTLPPDDCHHDLREGLLEQLKKNNVSAKNLLNVSLAWDWNFRGVTANGINREMVATLENVLRNRRFEPPKQSLAIPKLCLLTTAVTAKTICATREADGNVRTKVNKERRKQSMTILKGLLPSLEFVVGEEEEAVENAEAAGILTKGNRPRPNSWEHPQVFPIDPFLNEYTCFTCKQELSNTYMHCKGCEELIGQDFNICAGCHHNDRHKGCMVVHPRKVTEDSAFNHTYFDDKTKKACKCKPILPCSKCSKCRLCCCTCHESFAYIQRMWDLDYLTKLRDEIKELVGDDKLPYHYEVGPRLMHAKTGGPTVD